MSEQVKAVVNSFRHLTNGEQTLAYMEIEAISKAAQDTERIELDAAPSRVAPDSKSD